MKYDKNTEWLETLLRRDYVEFQDAIQKESAGMNDDVAWALLSIFAAFGIAYITQGTDLIKWPYLFLGMVFYLCFYYLIYKYFILRLIRPWLIKKVWHIIGKKERASSSKELVNDYNYIINSQIYLAYSFLEKGVQAKDELKIEMSRVDISESIFYLKKSLRKINVDIFQSEKIIDDIIEYKNGHKKEISIPLYRIVESMEFMRSILISINDILGDSEKWKLSEYGYCIKIFNSTCSDINKLTGQTTINEVECPLRTNIR